MYVYIYTYVYIHCARESRLLWFGRPHSLLFCMYIQLYIYAYVRMYIMYIGKPEE